MRELKTGVLVVGGGLAGPYAALKLNRSGVDVVLATKGILGKSGCATKVVYYMHPGRFTPPDSEDAAEKGWNEAFGCFLSDQRLLRKVNELNKQIVPELEWESSGVGILMGDLLLEQLVMPRKTGNTS